MDSETLWDACSVAKGLDVINQSRLRTLEYLKELLDSYHGEHRSQRYYDLLVGDWIESYIHLIYFAWREVLTEKVSPEYLPIPVVSDSIAYTKLCFQQGAQLKKHLKGSVACLLKGDSVHNWNFESESVWVTSRCRDKLLFRLLRIFPARYEVLAVYPYFKCSRSEWIVALWRWRGWLSWNNLQYPIGFSAQLDTAWRRARASAAGASNDFDGLLRVLLPLHLPVILLEGFTNYRNAVLALPVARPKAVYSANALHGHMTFKFLVAEWHQYGTQLLYHQCGGGFGIDRIHVLEDFEVRVSDHYYTWGWRRDEQHVKPLSAPPPRTPRRFQKWLMLSCVDFPQVAFRLLFQPIPGGGVETMHSQTCDFLASLPVLDNLLIRPYPCDYGWGFVDMMREAAPEATIDDFSVASFVRYAESRLVIHNYLGTSWLETLALNIPTVCFYDTAVYAFREVAQPFIDALERVGVLHRSGIAAARFVSEIEKKPKTWWNQPDVQEARRNFVEHYANFSPDWMKQWECEFKGVIKEQMLNDKQSKLHRNQCHKKDI